MSAYVQICNRCEANYFPKRLLCGLCGSTQFKAGSIDSGIVESTTILPDGTQLATVVAGKPKVHFIARIMGNTVQVGNSLSLTNEKITSTEAVAFVPLGNQARGES